MVNEYKLKLDATLHVFCYFEPTVVVLWGKMTTISDISHHLLSGLLQCPVNSPETAFNHPVFFPKDLQSLQNWLKMSTNMHCTLWNMFKVQYVLVKIRWIFSATGGAWRVCPYNCLLNISNSCRDVSQGFEKKECPDNNVLYLHNYFSVIMLWLHLHHPLPHQCMGYPGRWSSRLEACWLGRGHPDRAGALPPLLPEQHLESLVRGCVSDALKTPFLLKEASD